MIITVGVFIGLILGLTGAGGSIFAVPLFILLLGLPVNDAMGVSLGAVSITAVVGVLLRLRENEVCWKPGAILATGGVITAPVGRWLGSLTDENVLLTGFSLLAVGLALRMWKQAVDNQEINHYRSVNTQALNAESTMPVNGEPCTRAYLVGSGLACGFLSGLFGVGGGFIIVPLLTLYTRMGIKQAVGTSLFVIALVSAAGFGYHLWNVSGVSTDMLFRTSFGSVLGILLGTLIAKQLAGPRLQKLFACSVIAIMAVTVYRTVL